MKNHLIIIALLALSSGVSAHEVAKSHPSECVIVVQSQDEINLCSLSSLNQFEITAHDLISPAAITDEISVSEPQFTISKIDYYMPVSILAANDKPVNRCNDPPVGINS